MRPDNSFPPDTDQPFPPAPPRPGGSQGQPSPPSGNTAPVRPFTLPGRPTAQPVLTQTYPNFRNVHPEARVHPEVALTIRNLHQMVYDLQAGVKTLQQQMIGGAVADATVAAGAVTAITLRSPGYYQVTPLIQITGDGTGAKAHAILDGNRVASVIIDAGGAGYTTATVTFKV